MVRFTVTRKERGMKRLAAHHHVILIHTLIDIEHAGRRRTLRNMRQLRCDLPRDSCPPCNDPRGRSIAPPSRLLEERKPR